MAQDEISKVDVPCAKCGVEREHSLTFKENPRGAASVTAKCGSCGNTISLTLPAPRRPGATAKDYVMQALSMAAHRRKIIKGKD